MEYVNKERLVELRNKLPDSLVKSFIDSLIVECEELPEQQWQTIEEFKANPVEGWCWICCGTNNLIEIAYYEDNKFYWDDASDLSINFDEAKITHVMPIKTPDAPK